MIRMNREEKIMKRRIVVETRNHQMMFYLVCGRERYFLFTQKFSKGVYDYFAKGRNVAEVLAFNKWNRNKRLDKTIEKIPMYLSYAMRELVA